MSHHSPFRRVAAPAALALAAVAPALASSAVGAGPSAAPTLQPPPKRNVVFVLADDLGWSDLSSGRTNMNNPHDFNETPAIARLAQEGASFDNAYACLNCSPTRAALMSGVYAPREQNNIYTARNLNETIEDDTLLLGAKQGDPTGDAVLPAQTQTVAETLDRAGYATGYVGKFHIARNLGEITTIHGWDENWGGSHAGAPTAYHASGGRFDNAVSPSLDKFAQPYTQEYVDQNIAPYSRGVSKAQLDALVGTNKHVTDAVGDATLDFIDRHRSEPFFAWMSQYAVHAPIGPVQARADLLAKYRAKPPGAAPAKPAFGAVLEGSTRASHGSSTTSRTPPTRAIPVIRWPTTPWCCSPPTTAGTSRLGPTTSR